MAKTANRKTYDLYKQRMSEQIPPKPPCLQINKALLQATQRTKHPDPKANFILKSSPRNVMLPQKVQKSFSRIKSLDFQSQTSKAPAKPQTVTITLHEQMKQKLKKINSYLQSQLTANKKRLCDSKVQ